jgi:hypothetical protein
MRRLFLSAGLVAGLLFTCVPAMAQAAPSERAIALSERYLKAIHVDAMMEQSLNAFDPRLMFKGEMAKNEDLTAMYEASQAATRKLLPKIATRMGPLIAEIYSEDELQAMVDFYESPVGQSILAKTPEMTKAVMTMTYELIPELMTGMVDDYCVRRSCKPEEKKALQDAFGQFSK